MPVQCGISIVSCKRVACLHSMPHIKSVNILTSCLHTPAPHNPDSSPLSGIHIGAEQVTDLPFQRWPVRESEMTIDVGIVQVGPDGGDTPLVKLFEFLVASMCLFLISDNDPLEPRKHEVSSPKLM